MRAAKEVLAGALFAGLITVSALGIGHLLSSAPHTTDLVLYGKCRDARTAFFGECRKSAPRTACEALWFQMDGRAFDGDPEWAITNELDCRHQR